jgi:hypothetical protein
VSAHIIKEKERADMTDEEKRIMTVNDPAFDLSFFLSLTIACSFSFIAIVKEKKSRSRDRWPLGAAIKEKENETIVSHFLSFLCG